MTFKNNKPKLNSIFSDLLIYSIFPLILLIFNFVPEPIKKLLRLNLNSHSFRLWQFFTNVFIHIDSFHLINNLIIYFIFGLLIIIIARYHNKRKLICFSFLISIFLNPVVMSFLNKYLLLGEGIFCGSSTVTSSLFIFVIFYSYFVWSKKLKPTKYAIIFLITTLIFIGGIFSLFNNIDQDWTGHIVGLVIGALIFGIFKKQNDINKNTLELI